jgi:hypothetical protein
MRTIRSAQSAILGIALLAGSAWGHDSGTPFADWMKSLREPDFPLSSCCGPADQYFVREYQPSEKDGMAFAAVVLGGHGKPDFAVEVPREKVIWDRVNPTGRGVIFIGEGEWGGNVLCFVPAVGM